MPEKGIVVLGSSNTDLVIRGPRLPKPGETVLGGAFYRAAGGKGANQAVAAARASDREVTFIAAVGDDDFGRDAIEAFRHDGIDTRYVRVVPGEASGVALILVDEAGENMISVASGANSALRPEDIDAVPDEVFERSAVFLASLESPWPAVRRGLQRARSAGLTTILNPAPAPATPELIDAEAMTWIDILTPNEGEAASLVDVPHDAEDDRQRHAKGCEEKAGTARPASGKGAGRSEAEPAAVRLGRTLCQRGCRACIVTLGPRGSLLVANEGASWQEVPARRVDAVDATGAGDAFNGALAAALAAGFPLDEAAQWANTAAAISVTRHGAQPSLPHRDEIDRLHQRT